MSERIAIESGDLQRFLPEFLELLSDNLLLLPPEQEEGETESNREVRQLKGGGDLYFDPVRFETTNDSPVDGVVTRLDVIFPMVEEYRNGLLRPRLWHPYAVNFTVGDPDAREACRQPENNIRSVSFEVDQATGEVAVTAISVDDQEIALGDDEVRRLCNELSLLLNEEAILYDPELPFLEVQGVTRQYLDSMLRRVSDKRLRSGINQHLLSILDETSGILYGDEEAESVTVTIPQEVAALAPKLHHFQIGRDDTFISHFITELENVLNEGRHSSLSQWYVHAIENDYSGPGSAFSLTFKVTHPESLEIDAETDVVSLDASDLDNFLPQVFEHITERLESIPTADVAEDATHRTHVIDTGGERDILFQGQVNVETTRNEEEEITGLDIHFAEPHGRRSSGVLKPEYWEHSNARYSEDEEVRENPDNRIQTISVNTDPSDGSLRVSATSLSGNPMELSEHEVRILCAEVLSMISVMGVPYDHKRPFIDVTHFTTKEAASEYRLAIELVRRDELAEAVADHIDALGEDAWAAFRENRTLDVVIPESIACLGPLRHTHLLFRNSQVRERIEERLNRGQETTERRWEVVDLEHTYKTPDSEFAVHVEAHPINREIDAELPDGMLFREDPDDRSTSLGRGGRALTGGGFAYSCAAPSVPDHPAVASDTLTLVDQLHGQYAILTGFGAVPYQKEKLLRIITRLLAINPDKKIPTKSLMMVAQDMMEAEGIQRDNAGAIGTVVRELDRESEHEGGTVYELVNFGGTSPVFVFDTRTGEMIPMFEIHTNAEQQFQREGKETGEGIDAAKVAYFDEHLACRVTQGEPDDQMKIEAVNKLHRLQHMFNKWLRPDSPINFDVTEVDLPPHCRLVTMNQGLNENFGNYELAYYLQKTLRQESGEREEQRRLAEFINDRNLLSAAMNVDQKQRGRRVGAEDFEFAPERWNPQEMILGKDGSGTEVVIKLGIFTPKRRALHQPWRIGSGSSPVAERFETYAFHGNLLVVPKPSQESLH